MTPDIRNNYARTYASLTLVDLDAADDLPDGVHAAPTLADCHRLADRAEAAGNRLRALSDAGGFRDPDAATALWIAGSTLVARVSILRKHVADLTPVAAELALVVA